MLERIVAGDTPKRPAERDHLSTTPIYPPLFFSEISFARRAELKPELPLYVVA
jgi:hypothetical protein